MADVTPLPTGFIDRLKALMTLREMSVPALAKKAGVTPPAIYAWLNGTIKTPPDARNVREVATALGVTYEALWGAPVNATEQTRLLKLEAAVQQVQAILDDLKRETNAVPPLRADTIHHGEEEDGTAASPPRRRAR